MSHGTRFGHRGCHEVVDVRSVALGGGPFVLLTLPLFLADQVAVDVKVVGGVEPLAAMKTCVWKAEFEVDVFVLQHLVETLDDTSTVYDIFRP